MENVAQWDAEGIWNAVCGPNETPVSVMHTIQEERASVDAWVADACAAAVEQGADFDLGEAKRSICAILETKAHGTLHDYATSDFIRYATADEARESNRAAEADGGSGFITVEGRSCYVQD